MLSFEQSKFLLVGSALVASVYLITFIYRILANPLNKIPGPLLAKITPGRFLWHAWRGDLHLDHVRNHQKYGSVYRSSPQRVIFNTFSAACTIYSNDRTTTKADGYASHPFTREEIPSLFNCIDADRAASKKKVIRPTTLAPAMALQHAAIEEKTDLLAELVKSGPQDMSQLAFYYALDVISKSTFGDTFNTMRDPTHRWMCQHLERGNKHMYLYLAWPQLFNFLSNFISMDRMTYPEFNEESKLFLDLCHSHLEKGQKLQEKGERGSIYDFMKAEKPAALSQAELLVDAFSFMRGGGDMVAVTIAAALHYIAQDPVVCKKLTDEIRSVFHEAAPTIGPDLESCKYLRACIDEALRMCPPGPGVFWRTTNPSKPITIDGTTLPAGTDFGVGVFAFHFNPELFPEPCSFRPERYLEDGAREKIMPFLRGFRSCPAQKHAYATILLPVARLVWEFELNLVERTKPSVHPQLVKDEYQKAFGSAADSLYLQTDTFGSRIEGPILECVSSR